MIDDVIYYTSLLLCISLGTCYRKIDDPIMKRNYGAGLGVLVACLICGSHVYHSLLMVWGNVIIIKCCDQRFSLRFPILPDFLFNLVYVHQMSMLYTWSYLLYLHCNMLPVYIIWLHQTMALRLVGLAFEVQSIVNSTHTLEAKPSVRIYADTYGLNKVPSAIDIIAYSYYFIGLHRGPYYRWFVYHDHLSSSLGALGDCRVITEHKLMKAALYAVLYILLKMKFPIQMYYEDAFYKDHCSDYRYLYNVPQLLIFFLHYQMLMMLCTSVCTEAGLGVYPAKCEPLPGHGPSVKLSFLKVALKDQKLALEQEYNFAMLKCFDNFRLIKGPKMVDTLRGWDMPTRYWFWSNISKNLLKSNKEVRSACSFFAWTVWYGPTLKRLIFSATIWVYINLEAEYSNIYNTTGQMKAAWDIGFSMMRLFCLIYLTPCFVINDTEIILKYYNSMFWMFHFLLLVLIVGAVVAQKNNRSSRLVIY